MNKAISNKILSYTVIYEEDPEGGYIVSVPALPGCHTQGETIEEAEKNVKEAITVYLDSLDTHQEKITKEPRILQGKVEIPYSFNQ